MFDIKKVWKLGGNKKDDDANTFRWKNLNLLEECISLCWQSVRLIYRSTAMEIFLIKSKLTSSRLLSMVVKRRSIGWYAIFTKFTIVTLTIIMLSQTHDACLDLIDKINEIAEDGSPLKEFLETLVQKYVEITGTNESADTIKSTPPPSKRPATFSNPDSIQLYERISKIERDLLCICHMT
jgi:hypothetical protein